MSLVFMYKQQHWVQAAEPHYTTLCTEQDDEPQSGEGHKKRQIRMHGQSQSQENHHHHHPRSGQKHLRNES